MPYRPMRTGAADRWFFIIATAIRRGTSVYASTAHPRGSPARSFPRFTPRSSPDHELAPGLAVLRAGSRALTEVAARLRVLAEPRPLTVSMEEMAASLARPTA